MAFSEIPLWTPAFPAAALWAAWLWRDARRNASSPFDAHPALFPFALSLAVYLSTFRWHGGDDIPNIILPFALLRHGTLSMEPFRAWFVSHGLFPDFTVQKEGLLLSRHPVMPGLLALPICLPAVLLTPVPSELLIHGLSKLAASALTAASAAVFHLLLRERCSRRWAASATLLYAFGTFSFSVSSQALFQHGPAQLGLILGLYGLLRRGRGPRDAFVAGFGFALAVACRLDSAFFLAPAGLYVLSRERRRLPLFAAGAALPLAFLAFYWLAYTGRLKPQDSEVQRAIFAAFEPRTMVALLASPTRGLLPFIPASLFGLWTILLRLRDKNSPWIVWLSLSLPAVFVFYSFYYNWTGGMTFGSRYLATAAALAVFFAADSSAWIAASAARRKFWCLAVAWSILVHAVGAYFTWPGSYEIEAQRAQLWQWSLYPPFYLGASFGPLSALPAPARLALALLAAAATLLGARRMNRWLAEEGPAV